MKKKNYLSYGSVVVLKGGNVQFMIIRYKAMGNDNKVYDYIGVELPQGFQGIDKLILFNHSDIGKVIFNGYVNESIKDYIEDIEWYDKMVNNNE